MHPPSRSRRLARTGFTLLELTIVLAITGILLTLAIPRFSAARNRWAVRSALGDVGATFALARQTALARRAPVAVVLDTANGTVRLRSGGSTLRVANLSAAYGISLGATRDSAVYDPKGLGYGVSNLTVTIRRGTIVDTLTMSRLGRTRW